MPTSNSKPDQGYINHVALVLDGSGSMAHLISQVIQVVNNQIAYLAETSKSMDQETRVTVYSFDNKVKCLFYDKDVLRLPELDNTRYYEGGSTALIDATFQSIEDLEKTATLYGDHAFLLFVITDGLENASRLHNARDLATKLGRLPDHWTIAALVPDATGVMQAKNFGFAPGNITVWDSTSVKGLNEGFQQIRKVTEMYMQARPTVGGVKKFSRGLFTLDTSNLNDSVIQSNLMKLSTDQYDLLYVTNPRRIDEFVESATGKKLRIGNAFYQLTKTEEVQPQKAVALLKNATGEVFTGSNTRSLLGLPNDYAKVAPASHPDYTIFVQSTAPNRNLVADTKLLLLK